MSTITQVGKGRMGKPVNMSDSLALIQELLQETRDEQRRTTSLLSDLRVDVAKVQRSHDDQRQSIADFRSDMRQFADRLVAAELKLQPLENLEARQVELEGRVRVLEGDGREVRVVHKGMGALAREVLRYMVGVIGGLLVAAALWAVKHGGPPQ